MSDAATLLFRLEGPMQAWGIRSKWRIRETEREPSFSGVIGLLCAALGWGRDTDLIPFHVLRMGVRVDQEGRLMHDYHTVGAGIGNLTAEGKIKITQTTGEIETLISERYYLADASFLVALSGPRPFLEQCAAAMAAPVYPLYLGRKAFPPSIPIVGELFDEADLEQVLRTYPNRYALRWPRLVRLLVTTIPTDPEAVPRADVPLSFAQRKFTLRYVRETQLNTAELPEPDDLLRQLDVRPRPPFYTKVDKAKAHWKEIKKQRFAHDNYLCVFTGLPAQETHHITYARRGQEEIGDLRSLSKLCHAAVTMLEMERGMTSSRIDPFPDNEADRNTAEYRKLAEDIRHKMREIIANRDISGTFRARMKTALQEGQYDANSL